MSLIDTHCHIHDPEYDFDPEKTLENAHTAGVDKIIVIGTNPEDSLTAKQFASEHEDVFWSYGYHPNAGSAIAPSFSHLSSIADEKLVSIGEIGLDYHYQPFDRQRQIDLLEQMIDLAKKQDLPINFHVREAFTDFWPIIDNAHVERAVLHSFSDSKKNLNEALRRGFYIGVNGLATFASIPLPPLDRMVLETDAPYLTPPPFRGKINEPAYVKYVASGVAEKLGVPPKDIARRTTENARKLFDL